MAADGANAHSLAEERIQWSLTNGRLCVLGSCALVWSRLAALGAFNRWCGAMSCMRQQQTLRVQALLLLTARVAGWALQAMLWGFDRFRGSRRCKVSN